MPARLLPPGLLIATLSVLASACSVPASTGNDTAKAAPAPTGVPTNPVPPPISAAADEVRPDGGGDTLAAARSEADYVGRWIGVEGTYLTITARDGQGLAAENQYDLDHKTYFDASVTEEGLRFTRDGKTLVARPGDGNATGLKWLAGKKDCLTVKAGEGYCRS